MLGKTSLSVMAIISGVLLALMIDVNSKLAGESSAILASWAAHGMGAIVAVMLYIGFGKKGLQQQPGKIGKRYWLGGLPGAFTVVLASITVQSEIGLTGTLALALIGQFVLSLVVEHFGWFNQTTRQFSFSNGLPALCVAAGAILIIYGKTSV